MRYFNSNVDKNIFKQFLKNKISINNILKIRFSEFEIPNNILLREYCLWCDNNSLVDYELSFKREKTNNENNYITITEEIYKLIKQEIFYDLILDWFIRDSGLIAKSSYINNFKFIIDKLFNKNFNLLETLNILTKETSIDEKNEINHLCKKYVDIYKNDFINGNIKIENCIKGNVIKDFKCKYANSKPDIELITEIVKELLNS